MAFRISSRVFKDGEMIPAHYTADGEDVSPPLEWQEAPPGTKAFALICEDPDASGFAHWVVYNIPSNLNYFAEAYPALKTQPNGTRQGLNDFGSVGYQGPKPPSGVHRYVFRVYALSALLDLDGDVKKGAVERSAQRRVLAQAELTGRYQRATGGH